MSSFFKLLALLNLVVSSSSLAGTGSSGGGPAAQIIPSKSATPELAVDNSQFMLMENRMKTLGKASLPSEQGQVEVQELSQEYFTIESTPRRIIPKRPIMKSLRPSP